MLKSTLIASAALVGLMITGAVMTTAFAGTADVQTMAQAKAVHNSSSKMGKGHKLDHIANELNACELKPSAAERQSCIDGAAKI